MGITVHNLHGQIRVKEVFYLKPEVFSAVILPLLGTMIGSGFVFFMKRAMGLKIQCALTGFAAGVMVAASVWSLIIPAIEQSSCLGTYAFFPALIGVWIGIAFLLVLDHWITHLHPTCNRPEGTHCSLGSSAMTVLAVTLHNLPEGMAVGVVAAGCLSGSGGISAPAVATLSLGIAMQNLPEGAIISLPLRSAGASRKKAFFCGVLSGIVEPIGAIITILVASFIIPILPYLLAFAAGAMLYVVVEELIPEMSGEDCADIGTIFFTVGFTLMMVLDNALG